MTWLLCDYGEVLCLAPSAADRAALMAAADWDRARRRLLAGVLGGSTGL